MSVSKLSSFTNSQAYEHIKSGTLALTTALSAIALIGGVLALVAMQGVNLGPFNVLPSIMQEGSVYGLLMGGSAVLTISLMTIYTLRQHHKRVPSQVKRSETPQSSEEVESPKEPVVEPSIVQPKTPTKLDAVNSFLNTQDTSYFQENEYSTTYVEIDGRSHWFLTHPNDKQPYVNSFDSKEDLIRYMNTRSVYLKTHIYSHQICFNKKSFKESYDNIIKKDFQLGYLYPQMYVSFKRQNPDNGETHYLLIVRDNNGMCHTYDFSSSEQIRSQMMDSLHQQYYVDLRSVRKTWDDLDMETLLIQDRLHWIEPLDEYWYVCFDNKSFVLIPSEEVADYRKFLESEEMTRSIDSKKQIEFDITFPDDFVCALISRISSAPTRLRDAVNRMNFCEYYPLDLQTKNPHFSKIYLLLIKYLQEDEFQTYSFVQAKERQDFIDEHYSEWTDASTKK